MSYVLKVWEAPIPASVEEAMAISSRLHGERSAQNPKFLEFAQRLTKKHPCITTLPDESPRAVWSDGPLDGKTDMPIYGLGIQSDHLHSVHPFVIKTARAVGLVVLDVQSGDVFLPDGEVLWGAGRPPEKQPEGPPVQKRSELKPASIAPGEPYRLHVMCETATSLRRAEEAVDAKRKAAAGAHVRFNREWFVRVVEMLNGHFREAGPLPWFSGRPLEAKLEGELLTVEVRADRIGDTRDVVIRVAALQGLAVLDPHARQFFWPSGAFAIEGGMYSPWKNEEYPEKRAMEMVHEKLPPLVADAGFKRARLGTFRRKFKGGAHELIVMASQSYPGCDLRFRIDVELDAKAKLPPGITWPAYPDGKPLSLWARAPFERFLEESDTFTPLDWDPRSASVHVFQDRHVELAMKRLAELFDRRILTRVLPACYGVEDLNRIVNGCRNEDGSQKFTSPFYTKYWGSEHLMLAHLANDPDFERIRVAIAAQFAKTWETWPENAGVRKSVYDAVLAARAGR